MADAVVGIVAAVAGKQLGADPLGCNVEGCVRGQWNRPETCKTVA